MNDTYRRPGRLKLVCFAVLIFYRSSYSCSSGKGTGIASENQSSPADEGTNYTTQGEKVVSVSAKTLPNRDANKTFTLDQEFYRATPNIPSHGGSQQQEISASSGVLQVKASGRFIYL